MTESKAKPKAKRASLASGARKPAAKAAKTKGPAKPDIKAKFGARGNPQTAKAAGDLGDWRGQTLARMRSLILEADPEMIEEVKWRKPSNSMRGVPVWSHHGIVCTGETYANVVKLTFARGASLPDPASLFNSSLEGGTRRAIDIHEGEQVDAGALKALVKAAVAQNSVAHNGQPAKKAKSGASAAKPVKLLSGGNPQIAKGYGDAPVHAYIAAMPGWKSDIGRRLDALIVAAVPNVTKAVKWNSPFYGLAGPDGKPAWFLGIHCFNKYIKVAFFRGKSLRPLPPGESKQKEVRYLDIHEDDPLDEAQLAAWVKQAAALPGERM